MAACCDDIHRINPLYSASDEKKGSSTFSETNAPDFLANLEKYDYI